MPIKLAAIHVLQYEKLVNTMAHAEEPEDDRYQQEFDKIGVQKKGEEEADFFKGSQVCVRDKKSEQANEDEEFVGPEDIGLISLKLGRFMLFIIRLAAVLHDLLFYICDIGI